MTTDYARSLFDASADRMLAPAGGRGMIPVFDGHNDLPAAAADRPGPTAQQIFLTGEGKGHLDLPRMQASGFAGGFFAIYLPSPVAHDDADYQAADGEPALHPAPARPDPVCRSHRPRPHAAAGHLLWMERASQGALKICRTGGEVRDCLASGVIAAILHMEGAEAIDDSLDALHLFHAIGPALAWSGLVASDDLWPWRALCLSLQPRYRAGSDRGGQAAGHGHATGCGSCWIFAI